MQQIEFRHLIAIFKTAQATDAVQRYVHKEYVALTKGSPQDRQRAKQIKIQPETFVWAMELNDNDWNKAHPTRIVPVGFDKNGIPVEYAETGPLQDRMGQYLVSGSIEQFNINRGDYLVLSSDNPEQIYVVPRTTFESLYLQSENTDGFED